MKIKKLLLNLIITLISATKCHGISQSLETLIAVMNNLIIVEAMGAEEEVEGLEDRFLSLFSQCDYQEIIELTSTDQITALKLLEKNQALCNSRGIPTYQLEDLISSAHRLEILRTITAVTAEEIYQAENDFRRKLAFCNEIYTASREIEDFINMINYSIEKPKGKRLSSVEEECLKNFKSRLIQI